VKDVATTIDGSSVRKVIVVFASLCDEMKQLIAEAEESFYDPLSFYGEGGKTIFVQHPSKVTR
jgi:hypothetical protein